MNIRPDPRHRYGDWRDMTVEELSDWLLLQVTSWWRRVTLIDLYDNLPTQGGLNPQRGKTTRAAGVSESPNTLQEMVLDHVA